MSSLSTNLIQITQEDFSQKGLAFEQKLKQALHQGFCYAEIPAEMNIKPAKIFAENVRADKEMLQKHDGLGVQCGYQVREGTQAVVFSAKEKDWQRVYDADVQSVAKDMNLIATTLLKAALSSLSIPEEQWNTVTGGLTTGKGTNVFSFNNYQPDGKRIGLIPHKDMGWITVLFIDKHGLEAKIDEEWVSVPPKEGYFVINFGKAFEILINDVSKISASVHRVRQISENRISFGIFINHDEGTQIYQEQEGKWMEKQTYEEYLSDCFAEFRALQTALLE